MRDNCPRRQNEEGQEQMSLSITNVITVSEHRYNTDGDTQWQAQKVITLSEGPVTIWTAYSVETGTGSLRDNGQHGKVVIPNWLPPADYLVMLIAGEVVGHPEFVEHACSFGLTECAGRACQGGAPREMSDLDKREWEYIAIEQVLPTALVSIAGEVRLGVTRLTPRSRLDDIELEALAVGGIEFALFSPWTPTLIEA